MGLPDVIRTPPSCRETTGGTPASDARRIARLLTRQGTDSRGGTPRTPVR